MSPRAAFFASIVSSTLFAAGCGCDAGGGDPTPAPIVPVPSTASTLTFELGIGEGSFEPIAPNAPVTMTYGPQGGQHVWSSLQMKDEGYDEVRVNLSARFADSGEPAGTPSGWLAQLSTPMDGTRTHAGMRNYVDRLAAARLVILHADVVASDGRHGSDERVVLLSPK